MTDPTSPDSEPRRRSRALTWVLVAGAVVAALVAIPLIAFFIRASGPTGDPGEIGLDARVDLETGDIDLTGFIGGTRVEFQAQPGFAVLVTGGELTLGGVYTQARRTAGILAGGDEIPYRVLERNQTPKGDTLTGDFVGEPLDLRIEHGPLRVEVRGTWGGEDVEIDATIDPDDPTRWDITGTVPPSLEGRLRDIAPAEYEIRERDDRPEPPGATTTAHGDPAGT